MRSSIIGRARQAAHRLTDRFAPKSIILLYHRVADVRPDPWSLCVTPQHFAEHLEVLRQQSRPMHLQQLVSRLRDGNLPRHAVAITFDDGYADNLLQAKPALERYDIPATVFVATGNIEQAHEFWWDELERLLLQPGTLPEELRLSIDGKTYRWELG